MILNLYFNKNMAILTLIKDDGVFTYGIQALW